jgi:hypothetical protein
MTDDIICDYIKRHYSSRFHTGLMLDLQLTWGSEEDCLVRRINVDKNQCCQHFNVDKNKCRQHFNVDKNQCRQHFKVII